MSLFFDETKYAFLKLISIKGVMAVNCLTRNVMWFFE